VSAVRVGVVWFCLALTSVALSAQDGGVGSGRPGNGRVRPRDEAYKMVDAYLVSNMQESLGLTDEQFVKVLPLVKKLQSERRDQMQKRMLAMVELRGLLGSGRATEAQVDDALKEVKRLELAGPREIRKHMDALDEQLSVLQQAKFRIVEVEVERKVRELLNRAQRPEAGARRGPRSQERP
jgi:hypothetical protein